MDRKEKNRIKVGRYRQRNRMVRRRLVEIGCEIDETKRAIEVAKGELVEEGYENESLRGELVEIKRSMEECIYKKCVKWIEVVGPQQAFRRVDSNSRYTTKHGDNYTLVCYNQAYDIETTWGNCIKGSNVKVVTPHYYLVSLIKEDDTVERVHNIRRDKALLNVTLGGTILDEGASVVVQLFEGTSKEEYNVFVFTKENYWILNLTNAIDE